jgi:hypothetical protein
MKKTTVGLLAASIGMFAIETRGAARATTKLVAVCLLALAIVSVFVE